MVSENQNLKKFVLIWITYYFGVGVLVVFPVAFLSAQIFKIFLGPFDDTDYISAGIWAVTVHILIGAIVSLVAFKKNKNFTRRQKISFILLTFFAVPILFFSTIYIIEIIEAIGSVKSTA